jgi:hypothetical protein
MASKSTFKTAFVFTGGGRYREVDEEWLLKKVLEGHDRRAVAALGSERAGVETAYVKEVP